MLSLKWRRRFAAFGSDVRGATAIEFGFLAGPFFMFTLGVMAVGLFFFTQNSLESAVNVASRQIRTGMAQKNGVTLAQFKQAVCNAAGAYIKCDNLRVHIASDSSWSSIEPKDCVTDGKLTEPSGRANDPVSGQSGGASQVVLVTLCYEWELARYLPYFSFGNMDDGSAALQAVTTFRTEPYPTTAGG